MGRVLCKHHGVTGMIFPCQHIGQNLLDRVKSERIIKVVFPDTSDVEDRYKFNKMLYYCPACVAEYGFPSEDSEMPEENFDSMYKNDENFQPGCYDCYKELNY